jgi:HTTM domain
MSDFTKAWWRYWFRPASPLALAGFRVAFFAALLFCFGTNDFAAFGEVSPELWSPIRPFHILGLGLLRPESLLWVGRGFVLALVLSCIGLATRVSIIAALALGFYLLGLQHCFGKQWHREATIMLTVAVLAASRAGDALSVDAWLAARSRPRPAPSGEYRWPIRAGRLAVALMFWSAGYAKLESSGLRWISAENLRRHIVDIRYNTAQHWDGVGQLGMIVAKHRLILLALSVSTIVIEIGYPAALFSRRAAMVLVPSSLLLLVGFELGLGISFSELGLVSVLLWMPWDRLRPSTASST